MNPFSQRTRRSVALLVLLASALVGGCSSDDALVPVGDVDLDRLFAPPTEVEIQAVQSEWDARRRARAYEPGAVRTEYQGDLFGDGSRIVILSHTTGGAPFTHYGAVRIPPGEAPAGGWPVVVYNHGGSSGFDLIDTMDRFVVGSFQEVGSQSVVVVPTFRSEPMLNTPLGDLLSGGEQSPWDRDVDDALALLNATLQTFPDLTDGRSFDRH